MSDYLRPHGLHHARLPHPSPSPRACSDSCPLSQWCHPTISSSVTPFCPQSFPASESFPVSWLFASGGQSIGALASAPVLPMNIQDWSPLWRTGLISLQSKGLSRVFSAPQLECINSSMLSIFYGPALTSYMTTGKTIALTMRTFVGKVISLLFNTFSRFVITFLPRSKRLLISWLKSLSTVILEPKKIKSVTVYTFSPSICCEMMGLDAVVLVI